MKTSLADSTETKILDVDHGKHAVWFQNRSTTDPIYLQAVTKDAAASGAPTEELMLPPASASGQVSTLLIQATGGDETLVSLEWRAYQASGGALDIYYGRI